MAIHISMLLETTNSVEIEGFRSVYLVYIGYINDDRARSGEAGAHY